ncbi:hypothetical protein C0584_04045 [Candidatus Parcubacteria bacterium]|mgnify:CR=1 FL=1|nr:MAG: hypothetical protein C0584_04045 [Candidatus Parcubacteria bacterium]
MKNKHKIKIIIFEFILIVILLVPVYLNSYSFFFLIVSDSMNPLIVKNDIVIVKNKNIELEDYSDKIIAFFNPLESKVFVHRVVRVDGEYLITKGDSSSFSDDYLVSEEYVIGEIIKVFKTSKIF